MEYLSIRDIINIIRRYILHMIALSLAVGLLTVYAVNSMQTYTCMLGFKYNYDGAAEGLAPDGVSELDPYEIQNPVVIQGALENLGLDAGKKLSVKGIRQDITIEKVITDLDKEVSESAALLGEKYDAVTTEYEMKFTYDASLGDEFGVKMFSSIIKEYDDFLLDKYYNKRTIPDFAKTADNSSADYIEISNSMSENLDSIIAYLETLAADFPEFRSKRTGYSFAEIMELYEHIRDVQHAKYYGNIRAGNLAKDTEMIIKSYQTKVQDLTETMMVDNTIADNYKNEITTFYDPYKAAGLYNQAHRTQTDIDASNNRDQDVIEDYNIEEHINTYDNIVLSYADRAAAATDAMHTINYYNAIIDDYTNDTVPRETKDRLIAENDEIFSEILILSNEYSEIANLSISELFNMEINSDLQYLILPEVSADRPVNLIALFMIVLTFGVLVIAVLLRELLKNIMAKTKAEDDQKEAKAEIDVSGMDRLHQLLYDQYLKDFDEFTLVYQPMVSSGKTEREHLEIFIRWRNEELGMVSPAKIIGCISDFGIFWQLNDWIIKNVCADIAYMGKKKGRAPVVHVNCPSGQIRDFALNDIIIKHISENHIPPECVCLELEVYDIASTLEDITLLEKMGISICIDRFENTYEEQEILRVLEPKYIKMSLDSLNNDIYASSDEDFIKAEKDMETNFIHIIDECRNHGIKSCICGVETGSQDALITRLGFDYKQGYFYGKPEELKRKEMQE